MRKDFDIEYHILQTIIRQKDFRIDELKDALKKLMRMLRYPRLVDMLNKQLNFERVEFSIPKRSKSSQLNNQNTLEQTSECDSKYLAP